LHRAARPLLTIESTLDGANTTDSDLATLCPETLHFFDQPRWQAPAGLQRRSPRWIIAAEMCMRRNDARSDC
jgi:hypothetical protein